MRRWSFILSTGALAGLIVLSGLRDSMHGDVYPYRAAVYSAGPAFTGEQCLRLFPPDATKEETIPLPFRLGYFAVSPDGKTLYAQRGINRPEDMMQPGAGLFKIDFNPTRAALVQGSIGFQALYGIAVSAIEHILVSGSYADGDNVACGVFDFSIQAGTVKQVLRSANCGRDEAWSELSLSPDGLQAVATHNRGIELIDLLHSSTKPLGVGFLRAAWSPDGNWVAAQQAGGEERVILLETTTWTQKRTLGKCEPIWSPDSRYLLSWEWHVLCGPYFFTLAEVNVETGQRRTIASSRCKVIENQAGGAWVSIDVAR